MKFFILSLALLIAGYTSSFADNYFRDTLWMKETDQSNGFYMLKFSKNDSIIAGFGFENTIFYEAKTGNEIKRIPGYEYGYFINNDNNFIQLSSDRKLFYIWDLKTYKIIDTIKTDNIPVNEYSIVDISSDQKYLVAPIPRGFRVWDIENKKVIKEKHFKEEENLLDIWVTNPRFLNNNNILVQFGKTYNIPNSSPPKTKTIGDFIVYDFNSLDSINSYSNHRGFVLSNKNKYIAYGTSDNKNGIEIYDFASKQLLHKLPVNGLNVTGLEFSSDEKYLLTSDQYENMNTWNLESGKSEFVYINGCTSNFNLSHNQKNIIWSCSRLLSLYNTHWFSTSVNEQTQVVPTLYPNPTNGLVNINLQNPILGNANIQITNATGNIVMNISNIISQNKIVTFSITQLPVGTYLLTLSANNFNQTYKLIKE